MNWDDIRVFAAVAECKSINRAAHTLRVTPGMISRRLDELEAALEARLFNRSSTGVTLTSAGEDILDRALSMQRFAEAIEGAVRGRDQRNEGKITLCAPDGLAGHWIAPRLASFLSENPKVQVTLDCGALTKEMSDEPDLLITANDADALVGDVITPLATLHYLFVAAPAYLERFGVPQSLASAASEHRTIRHIGQTNQRESWGARARALEELTQPTILTNSSTAVLQAALAGAGICAAPSLFCHLHPELQIVGEETSIPIRLWLVTRRAAVESKRVQRFVQWLQPLFDTKLNPWFRDEFVPPRRFAAELAAIESRLASDPAARPKPRGPEPRLRDNGQAADA